MISWTVATIGIGIVLYIGFVFAVSNNYLSLPNSLKLFGPGNLLIIYRTQKGLSVIDKLANKYPLGWKYIGNMGVVVGIVIMILGLLFVVISAVISIFNPPEETISSPANFLIIPGVNDFLPLSVAGEIFIGFVIALVVHEGGHAILCRIEDIKIDSTGLLLLGPLPLGAFVEPDIDDQENASEESRLRMFAAGIMNNILVTGICIGGIIILSLFITVQSGALVGFVVSDTPVSESGISEGTVITEFDGETISSTEELETLLTESSQREVSVTTKDGETHLISRYLLISQKVESTFTSSLTTNDQITQINGETIHTISEFNELILESDESITIHTDETTEEVPLGSLSTVQQGSVIESQSSVQVGDNIVITQIDNRQINTTEELRSYVEQSSTSEYQIEYITSENDVNTVTMTTEQISELVLYEGYTGIQFSDTGFSFYPSDLISTLISPIDSSSLNMWVILFFFGPFLTLIGLDYNFYGFAGSTTEYYSVMYLNEPIVFILWNILYWTAWININLAIFNCLPVSFIGLDGSKILSDSSKLVSDKLDVSHSIIPNIIVGLINLLTLSGLLVIIAISII